MNLLNDRGYVKTLAILWDTEFQPHSSIIIQKMKVLSRD